MHSNTQKTSMRNVDQYIKYTDKFIIYHYNIVIISAGRVGYRYVYKYPTYTHVCPLYFAAIHFVAWLLRLQDLRLHDAKNNAMVT